MKPSGLYGKPPCRIAVLHGGPGAAGEMAPVASELNRICNVGIIEPFQTAFTVNGQVEELKDLLDRDADFPVTIIGFSWGAWLGYLFAARYPSLVAKLILVGSGCFEDRYTGLLDVTRLERLNEDERNEAINLIEKMHWKDDLPEGGALARFGALMAKADTFDPLPPKNENIELDTGIFHRVWSEASQLRKSGVLLSLGTRIICPVVAIHGDYDPHPAQGVEEPLSKVLVDFRFVLLEKCGHKPWIERQAKDRFFSVLCNEITTGVVSEN